MGTLTFEFPDFLIFSPNHCIKDIFRKGDRYILRSYWMKEHACLAVLLGTQMHLRFGYMKLDKNLLSLSTNSKASFSFLGESFFCTHKKKKNVTEHLNYYPTSIRHTMAAWRKHLPILRKLALLQLSCSLQQKRGKMELDYKHRLMTCHQKLIFNSNNKKNHTQKNVQSFKTKRKKKKIGSFYNKERIQGQLDLSFSSFFHFSTAFSRQEKLSSWWLPFPKRHRNEMHLI